MLRRLWAWICSFSLGRILRKQQQLSCNNIHKGIGLPVPWSLTCHQNKYPILWLLHYEHFLAKGALLSSQVQLIEDECVSDVIASWLLFDNDNWWKIQTMNFKTTSNNVTWLWNKWWNGMMCAWCQLCEAVLSLHLSLKRTCQAQSIFKDASLAWLHS